MRLISFIKHICAGIGSALITLFLWALWMFNDRSWTFMLGKSTYTTKDCIVDILVFAAPVIIVLSIMIAYSIYKRKYLKYSLKQALTGMLSFLLPYILCLYLVINRSL